MRGQAMVARWGATKNAQKKEFILEMAIMVELDNSNLPTKQLFKTPYVVVSRLLVTFGIITWKSVERNFDISAEYCSLTARTHGSTFCNAARKSCRSRIEFYFCVVAATNCIV